MQGFRAKAYLKVHRARVTQQNGKCCRLHRVFPCPSKVEWLYEHSAGNISVVVSLIHDAQEIAILSGKETLNLEVLNEAYTKRLALLHSFISIKQKSQTSKPRKKNDALKLPQNEIDNGEISIFDIVSSAKSDGVDIVQLLKEYMPVVEVAI